MWTFAVTTVCAGPQKHNCSAVHHVPWSWSSPSGVCNGCPSACQMLLQQCRGASEKYFFICVPLTSLLPSTLSSSGKVIPAGSRLVCPGEGCHTYHRGAGQRAKSQHMGDAALGPRSHPLYNRKSCRGLLEQKQVSVRRIFFRNLAWSFSHVFPQDKITNPAPILAWFLGIQASQLDFVHGLCYSVFTYSAGPSLIPSKTVPWRCTAMASQGKGFSKDYASHFLG